MKLARALLCSSCDEVHEDTRKCPWCGSEAPAFPLARAIQPMEREEIQQAAEEAIPETPR